MPADTSGLKVYVLVDGRAVPELVDPDAAPRDWAWLRRSPGQVSPEAAKNCGKQHKCHVATTAGTRFEIALINDTRHHLCIDTYVDGQKIDALSLLGRDAERDEFTGDYSQGPEDRHM